MNTSKQDSWFSRNWKWFAPVGCLTVIALFALFVAGIFLMVVTGMKSTGAYQTAMEKAAANAEVVEAIGVPIESGSFISGNFNESGAAGHAELSIPVSGPKGKATIFVVADKTAGQWTYEVLEVELANGRRIDLQAAAPSPAPEPAAESATEPPTEPALEPPPGPEQAPATEPEEAPDPKFENEKSGF